MFYAVGAAALLYIVLTLAREHMSVQDVENQQEKRKTAKNFSHTNEDVRPASTSKKVEKPIIGPKANPVDPNDPSGTGSNGKKPSNTGTYPEIYGGNYNPVPGHKDAKGEIENSSDPPPYDFVPAAEFPAGPSSPMPFLNDFSKILKYN